MFAGFYQNACGFCSSFPFGFILYRIASPGKEAKAKLEKARIPTERVGKFGLILLSPKPVKDVPGFTEGEVSVQDAGSQLAAELLDAKKGMRVLDACAAPGGKTAHILELAEVDMTALEIDPKRASRITENLDRLHSSKETGASMTIVQK